MKAYECWFTGSDLSFVAVAHSEQEARELMLADKPRNRRRNYPGIHVKWLHGLLPPPYIDGPKLYGYWSADVNSWIEDWFAAHGGEDT